MNNMKIGKNTISAYIIPSSDAHNSEYLSDQFKRLQFISNFTGSSGTAVITNDHAILWTDSRYFIQARKELDSSWHLMKDGMTDTLSIGDWLCSNLHAKNSVGIDATLYEEDLFSVLYSKLKSCQLDLIHIEQNLVDLLMKPLVPLNKEHNRLIKLDEKYVGKRTSAKLKEIRDIMNKLKVNSLVVTSLDEIAWLLNMRYNGEMPFSPVFFAYVIITKSSIKLFTNLKRLDDKCNESVTMTFKEYLRNEDENFEFYEYNEFYRYFSSFVNKTYSLANKDIKNKEKIFLSSSSNHVIHSSLPLEFIHKDVSLLLKLKVIKSENEIQSAKRIHIRDSSMLVEFFYQIDKHFKCNESNCSKHDSNARIFEEDLNEFELAQYLGKYYFEMKMVCYLSITWPQRDIF